MAKRFMYVAIGILCLVAAYQLGAERARADASAGTMIHTLGHNGWVLDTAGQVWNITRENCWERTPTWDLPVPLSDVAMWDNHALITTSGIAWRHDGVSDWIECGPHPGGPISLDQKSWGSVKGNFR